MKEGYVQELQEGTQAVEKARGRLEQWYARKLEDADIVPWFLTPTIIIIKYIYNLQD